MAWSHIDSADNFLANLHVDGDKHKSPHESGAINTWRASGPITYCIGQSVGSKLAP